MLIFYIRFLALIWQTNLWPNERHLDALWIFALSTLDMFQLSSLSHFCSAFLFFFFFSYYSICFCHLVKGTRLHRSLWEFVLASVCYSRGCMAARWLLRGRAMWILLHADGWLLRPLVKGNQEHKASVSFPNNLCVSVNLTERSSAWPSDRDCWRHLPHVGILFSFSFFFYVSSHRVSCFGLLGV